MGRDVTEQIKARWPEVLDAMGVQRAQTPGTEDDPQFICPICGHGKGGDGLRQIPNSNGMLKCFGCGFAGSVIDLQIDMQGGDRSRDFVQARNELACLIGLHVHAGSAADWRSGALTRAEEGGHEAMASAAPAAAPSPRPKPGRPMPSPDSFRAYYDACHARLIDPDNQDPEVIHAMDYLAARGLTPDTVIRFKIGFDPFADPAASPAGSRRPMHPAPRIIIPCSEQYYTARAIHDTTASKYMTPGGAAATVFNAAVLNELQNEPGHTAVFVTEGAFDAMALTQIGFHAVAMNSASNVKQIAAALIGAHLPRRVTVLLALDQDEAGALASDKLVKELRGWGIRCVPARQISGKYHDCAEAMAKDQDGLRTLAQDAIDSTGPDADSLQHYHWHEAAADAARSGGIICSSGYGQLDDVLNGGIRPGLYMLAATTGMGKTTLALQMALRIADRRNQQSDHSVTVMFFSYEMSKLEMYTKAIAGHMAERAGWRRRKGGRNLFSALYYRDPANAEICRLHGDQLINRIGNRLQIIECGPEATPEWIRQRVMAQQDATDGGAVIAICDYLQIMPPDLNPDGRMPSSRREGIDHTVSALKRMTRGTNGAAAVILISAVTREAYSDTVQIDSGKESGGIEYALDVMLGLDLSVMHTAKFRNRRDGSIPAQTIAEGVNSPLAMRRLTHLQIAYAMSIHPRRMILSCLKNRFGTPGGKAGFAYYPEYDCYLEFESLIEWCTSEEPTSGRVAREMAEAGPALPADAEGQAAADTGTDIEAEIMAAIDSAGNPDPALHAGEPCDARQLHEPAGRD